MKSNADKSHEGMILFISHDSARTGAPIQLLNIMRWLRSHIPNGFRVILRQDGPLESEFREVAEVGYADIDTDETFFREVCLIYSNTITNGLFLGSLPYGEIPIITHAHEMDYMIERYGKENMQEVQRHSAHFVACSNATAAALTRTQGITADKISIIPEAVFPAEIFRKSQSRTVLEIRNSLRISADAFVVVGCGTIDLRKGVDLFIQLADRCVCRKPKGRELEFLWIGSIESDPISDILRRDAKKLKSAQNLRFLGETETPYPYLAASDLFCLTSREDPFPLVMLEAGALGKPTLAFEQSGGAEEYCAQGGGFVVPYLDVAGMSDWILEHLENNNFLAEAGRKAQKLVQNEFNLDVTGPKFAQLIERFMQPNALPAAGRAQVFVPAIAGYSEEASIRRQVKASQWNRISFDFRAQGFENNWSIRFDPLDRAAVIEISRIALNSAKHDRPLWEAKKLEDFNSVRIEGDAIRLQDTDVLKLLSLGPDPILCLPELTVGEGEQEFTLEVVLRADSRAEAIVPHWQPLLQAYRENNGLSRDMMQSRTQLTDVMDNIEKLGLSILYDQVLPKGRITYILGTGLPGQQIAAVMLRHGYSFQGFIDADPKNRGQLVMEHSVFDPSVLSDKPKVPPFIIVASQFHPQISKQLELMGFVAGVDFAPSPFI